MSPTRIAAGVAVTAVLSLSTACGGSSATSGTGALGSTSAASPTTAATTPSVTPVAPVSTPVVTRTPTKTPTADGGDGDAAGDNQPSTAGGGVCTHLGADQVGTILGVAVRGAAVPDETGCTFTQGDQRGMSVTVLDKTSAEAHGMAGAKEEANSAVEGQPQDLSGIGSAAFVVTGSMFGGPDVNAAGAVQVGSRIVSVYLVQRTGLAESRVRSLEIELLKLVAKARS